jgi:sporulation protein YlmC with PRC-barrel domain
MKTSVLAAAALGLAVFASAPTTAKESLMTTLPDSAIPISDVYKQSIYDPKDNKVGDVNDVLLDTGGKVEALILGVGGFLGIGEKNVAVPFGAIAMKEKDGSRYLVIDTTKEALESAPGYSYDSTKKVWIPARDKRASTEERTAQ